MKPLVLLALNCGWVVHAAVIGLITGIEQCAPEGLMLHHGILYWKL